MGARKQQCPSIEWHFPHTWDDGEEIRQCPGVPRTLLMSPHHVDLFESREEPGVFLAACRRCGWRGDMTRDHGDALREAAEHANRAAS